jgi:exosortase F-associated protein
MSRDFWFRGAAALMAVTGLLALFLYQQMSWAAFLGISHPAWSFIFNRTVRFLLNDSMVVLLIYALFRNRRFTLFALVVQAAGFVLILLPYLVIKFHFPAYNGPLISFLHRLIVNPLLMLLLIPAFYLQTNK